MSNSNKSLSLREQVMLRTDDMTDMPIASCEGLVSAITSPMRGGKLPSESEWIDWFNKAFRCNPKSEQ